MPNPLEAAESLVTFRQYMLIFLPFVHLPATMREDMLRETYPFLWFSIMTVTCKNADKRVLMSEAVKKFIAQKLVVEHEKDLDLLLALLVILGWYAYPHMNMGCKELTVSPGVIITSERNGECSPSWGLWQNQLCLILVSTKSPANRTSPTVSKHHLTHRRGRRPRMNCEPFLHASYLRHSKLRRPHAHLITFLLHVWVGD